jgi:hypothetical protein
MGALPEVFPAVFYFVFSENEEKSSVFCGGEKGNYRLGV